MLVASVICFQKIYGLHCLDYQIIEYSKTEKSWRKNGQTDRQKEFPLVGSTPLNRLKTIWTKNRRFHNSSHDPTCVRPTHILKRKLRPIRPTHWRQMINCTRAQPPQTITLLRLSRVTIIIVTINTTRRHSPFLKIHRPFVKYSLQCHRPYSMDTNTRTPKA